MTKKIAGAIALLIIFFGMAAAFDTFYPFEVATGQIKTPAENLGAPWFQDNKGPAFGSDKDFYLKFDSANNRLALTGAGSFSLGPTMALAKNATTIVNTTFTNVTLKNVIPVDASATNVTITLPDAAALNVAGEPIFVGTATDPGDHYVKVNATGGDKLGGAGGATTLMTTSASAGMTLVSDSTNYEIMGDYGTWS